MKQLNEIEIETIWGFKSFELLVGDISQLDTPVDVMAVSVLVHDYRPIPGTVVSALEVNRGIELDRLFRDREFNVEDALSCWVSQELPSPLIKRILCVELLGWRSLEEVLQNVFVVLAMLEAKGIAVHRLALPLLGTGDLGLDVSQVIQALLRYSLEHMRRSESLRQVLFVTHDERKAEELSQAMNDILGRIKVVLPKGDRAEAIRRQVLQNVRRMEHEARHDTRLLADLRRVISNPESRSWELGIHARKLLELVVGGILGATALPNLAQSLNKVRDSADPKLAKWTWQYMQVLREMGNEAAHEESHSDRVPATLDEDDLELCLLCLNRLLEFWLVYGSRYSAQGGTAAPPN